MRATPEQVLRRVRAVIGTKGNESAGPVVAQLVLRRVLFGGEPEPAWRNQAACAGMPAEAFYPASGDHEATEVAKRVCRGCPVRAECLADALGWEASGRRHGIVGGLSARQRDQLATLRRREQQIGGVAA
jgi:hypothetical protein